MCHWQPRPQGSTLGTSLVSLTSQTPTTLYATSTFPVMHLIYPRPPPPHQKKKLHNLWFSFFLGFIAVLREIENNARAMQNLGKRRGAGGEGEKQGALWEMCQWRIVKTDLSTEAQVPTPQYGQYFTHAHNHITPVVGHGQL